MIEDKEKRAFLYFSVFFPQCVPYFTNRYLWLPHFPPIPHNWLNDLKLNLSELLKTIKSTCQYQATYIPSLEESN